VEHLSLGDSMCHAWEWRGLSSGNGQDMPCWSGEFVQVI
jgi:hypothetical protein